MRFSSQILGFAIAVGMILVAIPLLPTKALIQLHTLYVADGQITLGRTVTVPTDALMTYEVGNGHSALPHCNRSAVLHYEYRDGPLTFPLICSPPEGEWTLRYCVAAQDWFGLRMRPSCIEANFVVGRTPEMRQEVLEKKVEELMEKLNATSEWNHYPLLGHITGLDEGQAHR